MTAKPQPPRKLTKIERYHKLNWFGEFVNLEKIHWGPWRQLWQFLPAGDSLRPLGGNKCRAASAQEGVSLPFRAQLSGVFKFKLRARFRLRPSLLCGWKSKLVHGDARKPNEMAEFWGSFRRKTPLERRFGPGFEVFISGSPHGDQFGQS